MKNINKTLLLVAIIAPSMLFGLSACAQLNKDLVELNKALTPSTGTQANAGQRDGYAMAVQSEGSQGKQTQLIVPNDKKTAKAMNEALPIIKKVLGIHQCVKDSESLRQMNIYAIPGNSMEHQGYFHATSYPNSDQLMKYHDRNKCVSVTTLDQWSMSALNALQFRAVYFAEDSGETVNFKYLFKKVDDGSWKIAELHHSD